MPAELWRQQSVHGDSDAITHAELLALRKENAKLVSVVAGLSSKIDKIHPPADDDDDDDKQCAADETTVWCAREATRARTRPPRPRRP